MMQNNIIKVGITGGAGSGKTMLCDFLKELGYKVIYADIISREVHEKYPEIKDEIKNTFGEEFFNGETLKRKELGNRIFSSKEDRINLENIIIPFIIKEIFIKFDEFFNLGYKICFLDAPTLFENNLHKKMNYSILIYVDKDIQLNRLMMRDKISKYQAENIIKSQMDQDEKVKLADFIIKNNSTINHAKESLIKIINIIEECYGEKCNDCY